MQNKKVIFFGTPSFATAIFCDLIKSKNIDVIAIFTQPDKLGDKNKITKPHIKEFCESNNIKIPLIQEENINNQKNIEYIKSLEPDFIIVAAFGQIFKKELLDISVAINLHTSILPQYRGSSPIQYAILDNKSYTGVTAMLMSEGLDCGDILSIKYIAIDNDLNYKLFDKLSKVSGRLIIDVIENFDNIKPMPQQNLLSSYAPKINKMDGVVDFKNAQIISNKYRAYHGWPSIFLENRLKLIEISLNEIDSKNNEGEILKIDKDCVVVGCLIGSVKIKIVQIPTKMKIDSTNYTNNKNLKIGDIFH